MAGRAAERLDQERLGLPSVQHAGSAPSASRMETRLHGAESAADGDDAGGLKACSFDRAFNRFLGRANKFKKCFSIQSSL